MSTKVTYYELKAAITVIHEIMHEAFDGPQKQKMDKLAEAYATLFKFAGLEEKKDEEK